MKTTRKYTKLCALLLMLVMLLTACGEKNTDNNSAPATTNSGSDVTTAESAAEPADDFNIDEWGTYYETAAKTGEGTGIFYSVRYPSLIPVQKETNIAYQMDSTLAMVGYGGPDYRAKNVEDVMPACMDKIIDKLTYYRPVDYGNFAFNIETTESVTINDFPACKYTGTHTYTIDDKSYEVPFAAYALDLNNAPEAYIYIIVIDESVLYAERLAVEDGVIEDYAYKMALSVKLRK